MPAGIYSGFVVAALTIALCSVSLQAYATDSEANVFRQALADIEEFFFDSTAEPRLKLSSEVRAFGRADPAPADLALGIYRSAGLSQFIDFPRGMDVYLDLALWEAINIRVDGGRRPRPDHDVYAVLLNESVDLLPTADVGVLAKFGYVLDEDILLLRERMEAGYGCYFQSKLDGFQISQTLVVVDDSLLGSTTYPDDMINCYVAAVFYHLGARGLSRRPLPNLVMRPKSQSIREAPQVMPRYSTMVRLVALGNAFPTFPRFSGGEEKQFVVSAIHGALVRYESSE